MQTAPRITVEPLDDLRRKFVVDRAIAEEPARKFTSTAEAGDVPLAGALLAVPGVCEVIIGGEVVTVVQDGSCSWETLEPEVHYALETVLATPDESGPAVSVDDDDAMFDVVDEVFRTQVNPAVAQHGGRVDLLDVQDGVVVVRMMGGCQGCGMANVTLRQGIEATLKRTLPAVQGIKDITDHSAGTNPYFSSAKK